MAQMTQTARLSVSSISATLRVVEPAEGVDVESVRDIRLSGRLVLLGLGAIVLRPA